MRSEKGVPRGGIPFCALGNIQLRVRTELGLAMIPLKFIVPQKCVLIVSGVGTTK
jgi:hypothetical protein